MKIDPRIPSSNEVQSDPIKTAKGTSAHRTSDTKASDPSSLASGDTVQLSSRHAEIQRLNAQAANVAGGSPQRANRSIEAAGEARHLQPGQQQSG